MFRLFSMLVLVCALAAAAGSPLEATTPFTSGVVTEKEQFFVACGTKMANLIINMCLGYGGLNAIQEEGECR